MKKLAALSLSLFFISTPTLAKSVKSVEHAIDLVMHSIERNKLLKEYGIKMECVIFVEGDENAGTFTVDIHEKHNEKCGGDPETAPRLFSYEVNKKTGNLKTDARHQGEAFDPDMPMRVIK